MDLVYILGKDSTWGDREILYSLRSVEKYLTGYNQIFVVGECPPFLQNVVHIPCQDFGRLRQRSIFNKIMKAVEDERVSEDFIHFADDYFILQPLNVKEIGHYHNGLLSERLVKYGGKYRLAMSNTVEIGGRFNYDIHTPFRYNKERFMENVWSLDWEREYVIKSAYMRYREGEYMEDCKIKFSNVTPQEILRRTEGQKFLSTDLIGHSMSRFLKGRFPEPSKYEV